MFTGRDSLEDRARPDANSGEVVTTLVAVSAGDVHDAVPIHSYVLTEMGVAQGEGDIVARAEMFIDQR